MPLRLDDVELRDVPLREHRERRAAGLARDVGDGEVLLDDPLRGVEEDERDVGALGRLQRPQLGVVLDPLPLLAAAPQAGGVDEDEGRLAALQHRVDRVARRAGHLGDDHALAADEPVEERRLADVRAPEDRDADRLVPIATSLVPGRRETISSSRSPVPWPWRPESGHGSPSPSRWKTADSRVAARVVDLVREHDHGPLGGPQDRRELLVARRDPGPRVDDEEDEVGLVDRGLRLLGDLRAERAAVGLVDAARVDQPEPGARPLAEQLLAVARDAGRLVHDGGAALR